MTAIHPPAPLTVPPGRRPVALVRPTRSHRIPPAHSPLTPDTLWRAALHVALGEDARPKLAMRLCETYRADEALLFDSGTHALELAILMAERLAGGCSTIALPAYACFDVATAVAGAQGRIALYDVDPGTLAPDLDSFA